MYTSTHVKRWLKRYHMLGSIVSLWLLHVWKVLDNVKRYVKQYVRKLTRRLFTTVIVLAVMKY